MTQSNEMIVEDVRLDTIVPGDNDRTVFAYNDIESLAESIQESGLAQPITVRPIKTHVQSGTIDGSGFTTSIPEYEIVAGERRFKAFQFLSRDTIPAIVRVLDDETASSIMLAENLHRVDLNPIDEAKCYQKRIDRFGWTVNMLSQKTNVSGKRIADRLHLLDLAPEIQSLVTYNQVPLVYAETMAPLDVNRQRIAVKYMMQTDKPVLAVFRKIVGALIIDQTQEQMFNVNDFFQEQQEKQAQEDFDSKNKTYPIDEALPMIHKTKNMATSIEQYIVTLVSSGNHHQLMAAAVVGRLYQGMIVEGLCFPPKDGPLNSLIWQRKQPTEETLAVTTRSFAMLED